MRFEWKKLENRWLPMPSVSSKLPQQFWGRI